ncbi:MAG: hypothetical protein JW947_03950 [Sedimentisphaerales bacterium]|nr:hypothetical protein [Sedimentisphaerales bacterium]
MSNSNKDAKNARTNPLRRSVSEARRTVRTWLIRGLILVFCLWLVFVLAGKVLCEIALEQIAGLADTEITIESVDLNINGSVLIREFAVGPQRQTRYDDTILKAETVYARFGIGSLLTLNPRLKKISVKDFVFNAQHDLDTDRWNIAALRIKPPKGDAGEMPVIRLKRGTLQYSKVSNGQVRVVAAIPIDAGFAPAPKTRDGYSFNITTADRVDGGKSTLAGVWKPGIIKITGGVSSADIPALEKAWVINALNAELNYNSSGTYFLKLKIENVRSKPTSAVAAFSAYNEVSSVKPSPFAAMQRFFNRYRPHGTVAVDLWLGGRMEQLGESKLTGEIDCKDISICDRRFPYLIKQLTGRIDLTEKSAVLNNLRGRHGETEVIINGWSRDFGPNRKYQIRITSDNMALDNDLYEALSEKQKKSWSAFSPSGFAKINYNLSRQPQTDKNETLTAELLGAEAAYCQFPYPLKNLSGSLLFTRDSVIVSDLMSQSDSCKIILNGKVTGCDTDLPIYDISVRAEDVPLDSTLASSLSDEKRDFYNRLNMTGLADADIKIFTPKEASVPISFITDVSLKKTSLKADYFPLFISEVSAKTVITPELIQIEDFSGRHNQAMISLTGRIWPGDKTHEPRYCLLLNAEQTELNDDLISLLPKQLKEIVSELQPKGKINLTANLSEPDSKDCPDDKITVDCPGNSISLEPFPYPIKDITGRLTITKNAIMFEDITATATDDTLVTSNISTVKVNGCITLAENVFSGGKLAVSDGDIGFTADNLIIKGKTLTMLKADTCYDPNRQSWVAKNLAADCYGGVLAGQFELKQSNGTALEYMLQVGFSNVDLKQFLLGEKTEEDAPDNHTSGKMSGFLSVTGRAGENLPNIGRCRFQITDMQVGRLSPLAKLLYMLKLTEPQDFAFEQMFVDSYIKQKKLFLEQIDLSGKALAFNGSGWINLQSRNADLVLFARGRRLATAEPSMLQSLTEGLGQAAIRMEVTGNVYDPKVATTALPVINEAIKIFAAPRR